MHLTLKSATRWLLPPASAVVVAALLASCGGGDAEKTEAAADIEKLQADADEALEKARKLGLEKLVPDEYSKAKKQIEDAAAAVEAGDPNKAKSKWKSGTKALERLVEEQGQLSEDKSKVASTEKAAAAEAKKKADAAKAPANAATMYAEAVDYQKKAEDLLAKVKTKKELSEARVGFSRAKDLFEQSGRTAAENEIDRKRYEEEKKALEKVKAMATKAGAEEKAPTEWLAASQVERDALALFDRGEFRAATEQLKQTASAYDNALRTVATAADIAEMVAKGEAESEAWQKKSEEADKQRKSEEAAERARKEKELADKAAAKRKTQASKDGKKGGGGAIVPFDEFDPEKYPQPIDDEDLAFLNENYAKLTKSGVIEYDPSNGFVRLNYVVGREVEKDIEPIWLPKKEYLTFEDPLLKGTKTKDREEAERLSAFSMSGNTQGLVAFPVPFRYFVRVEYDMFIQTMNAASSYGTVLMFDPVKKTGYAQDWAKLGTMTGGKIKPLKQSPKGEYNGPADLWHIKFRGFPYMLEYKWVPGAEGKKASGMFQFDFDVGASDHVLNQLPGTAYTRGQVAFNWNGAKFMLRNIMITGILDKEAAVAKLRKITGIKKAGGGAAEKTGKKEKKKATETANKPDSKKGTGGGGNGTEKGATEKGSTEKSGTGGGTEKAEKPADGTKKPGDFDF